MRRILAVLCLTGLIFFVSFGVSSAQMFNAVWQVNSLADDEGAPIRFLDLDLEVGIDWIAAHGGLIFDDGAATCVGTGYVQGNAAYFQLDLQGYFLVVSLNLNTGGGLVDLYKMGAAQPIDSGEIVLFQAR